jgi:hypothetical protein
MSLGGFNESPFLPQFVGIFWGAKSCPKIAAKIVSNNYTGSKFFNIHIKSL